MCVRLSPRHQLVGVNQHYLATQGLLAVYKPTTFPCFSLPPRTRYPAKTSCVSSLRRPRLWRWSSWPPSPEFRLVPARTPVRTPTGEFPFLLPPMKNLDIDNCDHSLCPDGKCDDDRPPKKSTCLTIQGQNACHIIYMTCLSGCVAFGVFFS
jgi:hypothetical protein